MVCQRDDSFFIHAVVGKIQHTDASFILQGRIIGNPGGFQNLGQCPVFPHGLMVDTTGRPIFQPSAQPGAEGVLLGATIKIEDAVADGVILVGDPKKFVYNMVQDIIVETDKDIKHHVYTYAGYARGEGSLIDDLAFAQLTPKAGG